MKKTLTVLVTVATALMMSSCGAQVPEVSPSCEQALDVADEMLKINADALRAIVSGDTIALEDATRRLKAIDNKYVDLSKQCREATQI